MHVVRNSLDRMLGHTKRVHLINPLWNAAGGSEWRTLNLFDLLKDHCEVHLWSEFQPDPQILKKYPVKRIVPKLLRFPKTGTFVFVGAYFPIGPWIRYTHPRRIILTYNTPTRSNTFFPRLEQLTEKGRRKVEVVYPSELLKRSVNYPGWVQRPPIDIEKFAPLASKPSDSTPDKFTIGRLSRAVRAKHHPDDPALYRQLINHGCRIRIMGATPRLTRQLGSLRSVTLLPPLAEEPHIFLKSLDCLFYRTHPRWLEPWGLVVIEAMACGLPVVCHNRGGYVEVIDHGRNGFLFNTQQEAMEILLKLKEDRALRETIGVAARETSEGLFSSAWKQEIVRFYLQ